MFIFNVFLFLDISRNVFKFLLEKNQIFFQAIECWGVSAFCTMGSISGEMEIKLLCFPVSFSKFKFDWTVMFWFQSNSVFSSFMISPRCNCNISILFNMELYSIWINSCYQIINLQYSCVVSWNYKFIPIISFKHYLKRLNLIYQGQKNW